MSGSFIEYALLADARMSPFALLLGMDGQTLIANREVLANLKYAADVSGEAQLTMSAAIPIGAKLISWWMLILQAAVAAGFLLPDRIVKTFWRHGPMLLFLYTTYPIAQVRRPLALP